MNQTFIGIDPGLNGAVAIIDNEGVKDIIDTPTFEREMTTKTKSGKKRKKQEYIPHKMFMILEKYKIKYDSNLYLAMEKVHAMPKQGGVSMFNMGRGCGLWEGFIVALQIPYTFVTPQAWKKEMLPGMDKKDKKMSCVRGIQLFPNAVLYNENNTALDGRGDALLIAEFLRRTYNENRQH